MISSNVIQFTSAPQVHHRPTYSQDWPAYNAAQIHEQEHFVDLLKGLCAGIQQPKQGNGRPRLPLADVTFSTIFKVYSTLSTRRFMSDLRDAHDKDFVDVAPSHTSIFRSLENPALTPILKSLIEESATPLKTIETNFAVDSSGFATSVYSRWFDHKWGRERKEQQWLKAHLMVGVNTQIVTSVEVTEGNANDSPYLPQLIETTANHFIVREVSADKGYISAKNLAAVVAIGATPYIPFKQNTTGEGPELWRSLWAYYMLKRPEFLARYHQRSNVETAFSMIKRKFGGSLRAKTPTAQTNEVLCKVLCHNICCLISSIYELGIEASFGANHACAPKVA